MLSRKTYVLLVIMGLLVQLSSVSGQVPPQFSNYYHVLTYNNPAFAGLYDGDLTINSVVRQQWAGLFNGGNASSMSKTMYDSRYLSLDYAIRGLGINMQLLQDRTGFSDAHIRSQTVSTAMSYLVRLGSHASYSPLDLQFGIQLSNTSTRLDGNVLLIDDFIDGVDSHYTVSQGNYTNLHAGALLLHHDFWFGVSFYDLVKVLDFSQLVDTDGSRNTLGRFSVHSQVYFRQFDPALFALRVNFRRWNQSMQFEGSAVTSLLKNTFTIQLGLRTRPKVGEALAARDAIITSMGINLNPRNASFLKNATVSVVYTHDWTISKVESPNDSDEISLVVRFTGDDQRMRQANNLHYRTRLYRRRDLSTYHTSDITVCPTTNVNKNRYDQINPTAIEQQQKKHLPTKRIVRKRLRFKNQKVHNEVKSISRKETINPKDRRKKFLRRKKALK